jgi:hypothetical protein
MWYGRGILLAAVALHASPATANPQCLAHPTTIRGHIVDSIDHVDPKPHEGDFFAWKLDLSDRSFSRHLEVRIRADKHGLFVLHLRGKDLAQLLERIHNMSAVTVSDPICAGAPWIEAWDYAFPHGGEKRYETVIVDSVE